MMRTAIITSGFLPVPATSGGAVEAIVDNFIEKNEMYKKTEFNVFSIYDEKSEQVSRKYSQTKFNFIRVNFLIKTMDKVIFWFAKNILKKEKTMSYRYILQRLDFLRQVSKIIKRDNYDKILIENNPTLFLALKWRKNYKKYEGKYYYHVHNEISSDYGCTDIIKKCEKILCVSEYIKKCIINRYHIEDNVKVLINCVDTDRFNSNMSDFEKKQIKEKYGIKENEKILLFTGRLSKEKGIMEILEAISNINIDNYKLLIVGEVFYGTSIKSNFESKINNIIQNLKEKVVFTGYVQYEQINKIYGIADIAVLPSTWNDPAPLTIIEAMATGLPIITTNSGGIPEYAKDGCAIILKKEERLSEQLEKAIDVLLKDDEKRAEMRQISLKNAKELNLDNFYKNLIKNIGEE